MKHLIEQKKTSRKYFSGRVVNVYQDTVVLPNGNTATRDVVRHPGGVCVLAITPEKKIVLVRQYRYPLGQLTLEIPAGKLDSTDIDPMQAALRELAEETPYTAQTLEWLYSFYPTPGFCDEKLHMYIARDIYLNSELTPDDDEFLDVEYYSVEEVQTMIASGEITDGKTIMAIQSYMLSQDC